MKLPTVPTKAIHLRLPVPVAVGLRKMANNRKCTMAHLIRQMIYHHLDGQDYAIYVGRPRSHPVVRYQRSHRKG